MNTHNLRPSAKEPITLSKNEVRQLVFWAKIGLKKGKYGSYYDEVIETIKEVELEIGKVYV